jgi:outer membrane protein OmpA-like peptidoglycan-associated protein
MFQSRVGKTQKDVLKTQRQSNHSQAREAEAFSIDAYGNQSLLMKGRAGGMQPVMPLRPSQTAGLQRKRACDETQKGGLEERLIQPKLAIGSPTDSLEQEADRVAEQVLAMPDGAAGNHPLALSSAGDSSAQRKCAACEEEEKKKLQAKQSSSANATLESAAGLAAHTEEQGLELDSTALRNGMPLPMEVRSYFEPRFGRDFSKVRVHTDAEAAGSAKAINSLAFTYGQDVVFGSGQFDPGSNSGRRLIAHELTHVVQQSGGGSPLVQRWPDKNSPWSDWMPPVIQPEFPQAPIAPPSTRDMAKGACLLDPTGPLCKFYNLNPPPPSKTLCIPGFHGSTSEKFKDLCCKDGPAESEESCCPPQSQNIMTSTCCPPGKKFVRETSKCETDIGVDNLPPGTLRVPDILTPFGQNAPGSSSPAPDQAPKSFKLDFSAGVIDDFDINSDAINSRQESKLQSVKDRVKTHFQSCPNTMVELVGYADKPGTEDYNLQLGQKRADRVRLILKIDLTSPSDPTGGLMVARSEGSGSASAATDTSGKPQYNAQDRKVDVILHGLCPPIGNLPKAPLDFSKSNSG